MIVMNITWSAVSFGYFMIGYYMKYVPGNIYQNIILSTLADMISNIFSGILSNFIGTKKSMTLSFLFACVSGFILVYYEDSDNSNLIMILVLLTKLGITSAYNLCYLATAEYFPIRYASTIFGQCNVIARFATILSPIIAEIEQPNPIAIYAICNLISIIALTKLHKIQ
jgi:MFS family permease